MSTLPRLSPQCSRLCHACCDGINQRWQSLRQPQTDYFAKIKHSLHIARCAGTGGSGSLSSLSASLRSVALSMLGGVDGSAQDRERVDELNTLRGRVVALTAELRGVKGSLDITTSFQSVTMCTFLCETRMHIHTSNFTITGVTLASLHSPFRNAYFSRAMLSY